MAVFNTLPQVATKYQILNQARQYVNVTILKKRAARRFYAEIFFLLEKKVKQRVLAV